MVQLLWSEWIQLMNLIDHYNSSQAKADEHPTPRLETQWLLELRPKQSEQGLPNYLIYMRNQFEREYPHARVSVFADPADDGQRGGGLILSVLHLLPRWGRFQTYNEVVIDEEGQSVLVKGALLLNNQLVKIRSRQQMLMAIRRAGNLNPLLSPLRIVIDPLEGTLELASCSYVDAKFAMLNNSEKNIEYFSLRVFFILSMIFQQIGTLFYLLEDEHLSQLYKGTLDESIKKGESMVQGLENSLCRTHCHSEQIDYNSKINELEKHHQRLDNDVCNILTAYGKDAETVEYCKPRQIEKLASEYYPKEELAELATELDQRINFRVYSKIQFAHEDVFWQDLEDYSGNCKIEYAHVRFSIVPESPSKSRTRKQKSRETDDSDTLYAGEEARRPHVEAKITRKWLSNMAKMEREKGVVRQLKGKSHPNIMTFFESESPVDKQFIYTLFEQNQSLERFTEKCGTLSFFQKLFLLEQAAKGLLFLHRNNILHLDYKPANLIVGKKHLVKVCDFGQSCTFSQQKAHRFGSTFPFAAPEVYAMKREVSEKVDVYALGVTIYHCLFSQHIWNVAGDRTDFIRQLKSHKLSATLLPERFADLACSKVVRMLVQLCLRCVTAAPERRPTLVWVVTFLEESRKCLEQMHYK